MKSEITVGSLFSGIGGLDLGLERSGMKVVWQVEINEYCRRVLEKHWPGVRRWDDVRTFPLPEGEWPCDLICAGFPCQTISKIGKRRGDEDDRWLWPECSRIICHIRPRWIVLENVPELLVRGFEQVVTDLAKMGFDAEWRCIPANFFGAPMARNRLFLVAIASGYRLERRWKDKSEKRAITTLDRSAPSLDSLSLLRELSLYSPSKTRLRLPVLTSGGVEFKSLSTGESWEGGPGILRMAHGIPHRVERIKALGNAVVPRVAQWIGERIIEWENATSSRTTATSGEGIL